MAYDISVGIGVEGESQFQAALKECQNSVKQLDSALKANAAEYANNADALGDNAERAKLLAQSIELQKKMMQGLGQAVQYATNEYGEASAQTTKYVVAQNKARESVAKMEKELADMGREMEEVGRDSIKVGRQLENGIGDGADDAAKKLSQMMDDIRGELSSIGGSVGITATIDVIKSVGEGIENLSEQTMDYRRTVSYLEQNTKDAGQAWADVEAHLFRVTANTGSLEDASEGISNLLAAGLDSAEVADAVNLLLGAVIKFPQTYKFEQLAESLRNTIEEKQAVGQFSELLLGLGVDLDTFNKALEKTTSKEAAQDLALSFGANRGLEKTITEYETVNKQMLDANEATLTYQASLSKLAGQMEPIGTAYKGMATTTIEAVSTLLENTEVDEWIVSVIDGVAEAVKKIEALLNPENREIVKQVEETRASIERAYDLAQEQEERGDAKGAQAIRNEIEILEAQLVELENKAKEMGLEFLIGETKEENAEAGKEAGESVGTEVVQSMVKEIETGTPEVKAETEKMVDEVSKTVEDSGSDLKTAEDKALEQLFASFGENTPGIIAAAQALADGITEALNSIVWPDIAGVLNAYRRELQSKPVYDESATHYFPGGRINDENKTMHMTFNVNGRAFAEATIDDFNQAQGAAVSRGISLNA